LVGREGESKNLRSAKKENGDRVWCSAAGTGNHERLVKPCTVYGRFGSECSGGWAVPNTRNQLVDVPRNFSETTTEVWRSGFTI